MPIYHIHGIFGVFMGCPSHIQKIKDYMKTEDGLNELTAVAKSGLTLENIGRYFGISRMTLWHWCKDNAQMMEALNDGRKRADQFVENALYDACFDHKVNEIFVEKDADGNIVKTTVKTKIIPANITAQQYWLSNRRSDTWKARQQLDVTSDGAPIKINIINDLKPYHEKEDVVNQTSETDGKGKK